MSGSELEIALAELERLKAENARFRELIDQCVARVDELYSSVFSVFIALKEMSKNPQDAVERELRLRAGGA